MDEMRVDSPADEEAKSGGEEKREWSPGFWEKVHELAPFWEDFERPEEVPSPHREAVIEEFAQWLNEQPPLSPEELRERRFFGNAG